MIRAKIVINCVTLYETRCCPRREAKIGELADRSLFSSGRKQISSLELKNFIWIEDRIEITIEKVDDSR